MTKILQNGIPYDVDADPPLPGIKPTNFADWLHMDEAFSAQMALRDRLIADQRSDVIALADDAIPAAEELLRLVLDLAYEGQSGQVTRPDGQVVNIDFADPMGGLGRLVQEDFCILQKQGDEHVLTGAVLCFPASWSLSEKFMRPLTRIHDPVRSYDADIARRVQRLFDGVQPGRPLWRFNALWYDDPALHQPRRHLNRRAAPDPQSAAFRRSERQCILRLPETRAVVFSIHTYVVARESLPAQ